MLLKEKNKFFILLSILFVLGLHGCNSSSNEPIDQTTVKNIVLLIGDGMGSEHRKAARYYSTGLNGNLSMDDMNSTGWIQTASADSDITDSAAASTAMATGVKTNNGVIGLDQQLNNLVTVLEHAQEHGKSTGLVTNTPMAHATPAAFAAHVTHRSQTHEISEQMIQAQINVLFGGGENDFLPTDYTGCFPSPGTRIDNRNLIVEAQASGYHYVCSQDDFKTIDTNLVQKVLGLFADEGMIRPHTPDLASMTQTALSILSKNEKGFFLMVEGGQIDWASHANDTENVIGDTVAFDDAVKKVLEFAKKDGNTLVIVTSDHETGGMSVSLDTTGNVEEDGPFIMPDGNTFYVNWMTSEHTSVDVPVTSSGPGNTKFEDIHQNTSIYDVMAEAYGF